MALACRFTEYTGEDDDGLVGLRAPPERRVFTMFIFSERRINRRGDTAEADVAESDEGTVSRGAMESDTELAPVSLRREELRCFVVTSEAVVLSSVVLLLLREEYIRADVYR